MRRITRLLLAIIVSICGVWHASAEGEGNKQTKLTVSLNGQPVTIQTAWAFMQRNQLRMTFSSATPTCAEIMDSGRSLAPDEVTFDLIGDKWEGDEDWEWSTYFSGKTWPAEEGTVIEVTLVDTAPGGKTVGTVTTKLKACCDQPDEIEVKGEFQALGCGSAKK